MTKILKFVDSPKVKKIIHDITFRTINMAKDSFLSEVTFNIIFTYFTHFID